MTARVLVVEDDTVNMELIAALLEHAGCVVLTADGAAEGLRLAGAERPDLILMDLHMPGITGYEATRRLKADPATAAIPVVALTAQAMQGDEERVRTAGFDGYLAKPLSTRALRETLNRFFPVAGAGTM